MPEHGFDTQPPEFPQIRDQEMDKDLARTFQQWQQQEREDQRRKAAAEASMIDAAEILQKLDEKLDAEYAARLAFEEKTELAGKKQRKTECIRFGLEPSSAH